MIFNLQVRDTEGQNVTAILRGPQFSDTRCSGGGGGRGVREREREYMATRRATERESRKMLDYY